MSKQRIMIVEDETDIAEIIAVRLKREGFEVATASDGLEGLRKIQMDPPDLVLLDIMLPRMSGLDVIRQLRNEPRTAALPVIMLTAKGEESDIVVGLQLGSDDYITKPFSFSVLLARVQAVLRRSANRGEASKSFLQVGIITIDQDRHLVQVDGQPTSLTLTEFRLLSSLAAAKGRVLTRNQLIDQAMGLDAVVTDRTIDVHLTALRRKLGQAKRYLRTIRGVGYCLTAEADEHETD